MRLLILLLFAANLTAFNVDPLLLKAQASIFPKILLLDKDISTKLIDQKLSLNIVYTDRESKVAQKFKLMIEDEYKSNPGALELEVRLTNIEKFRQDETASAYYVFNASSSEIKEVINYASKAHRICFGYNYKDFENNVLVSLFVKEKTYIYLNKQVFMSFTIS